MSADSPSLRYFYSGRTRGDVVRHNRLLGVALAAGLATTVVTGCGSGTSSSATPTQTVNNAISADLSQPGLQMVFAFTGSPSAFTGPGSTVTQAQAQYLIDSNVVVTVHTNGSTPISQASSSNGPNAVELALVDNSANLADIRYLGNTLYARIDIPQITNSYGLDTGSAASFRQSLNQIATEIPAAAALNKGQWVSVDVPGALKLIPGATSVPSADPGGLIKLVDALLSSLQNSPQVSSTSAGYVLTVHGMNVANQLSQALSSIPGASSVPGIGSVGQAAGSVPASAVAKVTAVVANGKVTQLILPLNQFNGKNKIRGSASLKVTVSSSSGVATPTGVTAVNLQQVAALINQASGGSSSSGTS